MVQKVVSESRSLRTSPQQLNHQAITFHIESTSQAFDIRSSARLDFSLVCRAIRLTSRRHERDTLYRYESYEKPILELLLTSELQPVMITR